MVLGAACTGLRADPKIDIQRHDLCNLFDAGEQVKLDVTLQGFPAGTGQAEAVVTNYFGESKSFAFPVTTVDGQATPLPLVLGALDPGYYELNLKVTVANGQPIPTGMVSFGVVHLMHRTAEEAAKAGSRFGLKIFQVGSPGLWWRKGEVWDLAKVVDACSELGLQWTRQVFNQVPNAEPGVIGTSDLIAKHAMNVVLKIEGFPASCYDAARYGPLDKWKPRKKNKGWDRCTVPLKGPYQEWLKEQIAKIPESQDTFEIGNEVWDEMSAEEFAEWCKIAVEAIKQARPNAKVGADPGGGNEFSRHFVAAGGMDNMDIWYDHPYSFTPLPEHRIRSFVRNMREFLKRRTGHDYDLYVTEYGWSTAPQDRRKQSVSEKIQAERTTRESLMLYAEDAKVLIPHWMGDREQDPADRENWFGFFRLNQQPKPVLVAHAVCARMIDSSRFVGDLGYGPGIGAMLFERSGQYTLALWTAEEDKAADINVGVPEVTEVDMMGGEKKLPTVGGKISAKLNGDVLYLSGVSPGLAKQAVPSGQDMNPDQWTKPADSIAMTRMTAAPKIDGDLADWAGKKPVELKSPNGDAGTSSAMLAWDSGYVYLAVNVSGQPVGGKNDFQLTLRVRPDRNSDNLRLYDYVFNIAAPGSKGPALEITNPDWDKLMKIEGENDPSGARCVARAGTNGWTAELAIPIALLKGLPAPVAGLRISGRLAMGDTAEKGNLRSYVGDEKSETWPFLIFTEAP